MRKARSVFLGTASAPLVDHRERVRQELEARDYRVLPTERRSADDPRGMVRAAVQESSLSILFDGRTDPAVENPVDALATDERTVATEEGARQLVVLRGQPGDASQPWHDLAATDEGSKVEWLFDPPTHTLYHTVLQMLGTPAEPDARPQRLVRVYLICDRQDHPLLLSNRARSLRDHLLRLGFEVKLPLAEGDDAAEFSRDNRNKLRQCDGVLLYWGTARQSWFDQRLGELMQARGWRHGREFVAVGAFVADPVNPVKQNYETRELDELIKQFDSIRSRGCAADAVSRAPRAARMTETIGAVDGVRTRPGNPFPGLRPFEPHESSLFFGRDEQCDALLTRLARGRLVAVVGMSGSGKSSLVRAGLLPALDRGYLPSAGSSWHIAIFRPGSDPVANLTRALVTRRLPGGAAPEKIPTRFVRCSTRAASDLAAVARRLLQDTSDSLLVVADQFEEIFRFGRIAQSD